MSAHAFSLVLAGAEAPNEGMADKLFEAGCDDGLLASSGGISTISFMRAAPSLRDAVVSAINNVRSANIGFDIVRIGA